MSDNSEDQSFPNEPPFKDGASSFGAFYPKNYVLAVFAEEAIAKNARLRVPRAPKLSLHVVRERENVKASVRPFA